MLTQIVGLSGIILEGSRLAFEISRLRQLHLNRVHALRRPPIMTRRPAAAKAAIAHHCIARRPTTDILHPIGETRIARPAGIRPDIEIRKATLEQKRHSGTN